MFQESLFPVDIIREEDFTGETAHLKKMGVTRNGERYALKTLDDHPLLPLTEWFCYRLCQDIGIPTPGFAVVKRPDGSYALGSRIDADTVLLGKITINPMGVWSWVAIVAAPLSGMLGIDYFLPNPDRHLNNVLCRPGPANTLIALAFDWSLVPAIMSAPVFSMWPWSSGCNSDMVVTRMKGSGSWNQNAAEEVVRKVGAVSPSRVREYLEAAPEPWRIQPAIVDDIVNWWTDHAPTRAQGIFP